MKFKIASLFAVALILNAATPARAEDLRCSLARAAGNWAFTDSGTVVGVGPRVAVGRFTLDTAGNLQNGVATSSLNGAIAAETFSGTYAVNSDCTGTISVEVFVPGGAELFVITLATAFDDDTRHLRAIFTSVVEPNGASLPSAIALDARKQ
jgi:hypothetical protein